MSPCGDCKSTCRPSFVYVMTGRGDGCVKVGYAASVGSRAASLRKQFGAPIAAFRKFEMHCELEASLVELRAHEILDPHRRDGEWFECQPEVAQMAIKKAVSAVRRKGI